MDRVADLNEDIASVHKALGNRDTALEWYRRAEHAYGASREPADLPDRASRKFRAWRLSFEGEHRGALEEWQAVLAGLEPGDDGTQSLGWRAEAHAAIGGELRALDRRTEAITALRRALDLYERRAAESPERSSWQLSIARACLSLGELLAASAPRESEEARTLLGRGRAIGDILLRMERFLLQVEELEARFQAAIDVLDSE